MPDERSSFGVAHIWRDRLPRGDSVGAYPVLYRLCHGLTMTGGPSSCHSNSPAVWR